MRRTWLVLPMLLVGCATTRPSLVNLTPQQWKAEIVRRGVDPRDVPDPLATTEQMRETAAKLAGVGTPESRLAALQEALFDSSRFPFAYDVRTTLTAAEAFQRREGNCLSFTNLFVAMARSLGVPATTGLVLRIRSSEQEGDLIVVNNHVVALYTSAGGTTYYDFDRTRKHRPSLLKPLDDMWITGLYMNNRGADELRAGRPDLAARYFLDAVRLAPTFAPAWGNLGVARRRLGDTAGALDAYHHALAIDAGNPTILTNLGALYRLMGKEYEAEAAIAAANLTNATPHVLLVRGDLELAQGRVREAIRFYKRAKRLAPKLAAPWVALARAELAKSNPRSARHYLRHALRIRPDDSEARKLLEGISKGAGHE
jgi:Tfp pilus assembly protein PilF